MKKIIVALLSMLIMVPAVVDAKDSAKENQKRAKKLEKTYKKEGWKLFGSSFPMGEVLTKHFETLERLGDGATELMGTASVSDPKHKNMLVQAASTNAYVSYAGKCRAVVGSALNKMDLEMESDQFLANYEATVQKEIQGELQQSYILIKEGKAMTEAQVFYIVDEAAAERARLRSLEIATRGMKLAQDLQKKLKEAAEEAVE